MKRECQFYLILIALLLGFLAVVFFWSQQKIDQLEQKQMQTAWQAESHYQRSFGELSDSVEAINGQLAQLLVTSSQEQLLLGLSSLWREVSSAVSHLGSLPVAMYELENTDLLLSDVGEYSYYLLRKNILQQTPLSETDWNQLEDFYRRSRVVQTELDRLENRILNENLLLSAFSAEDEENIMAATFRSIESQVHAFPELKFEEGVRKIEPEPRPIEGNPVSREDAVEAANNFLDMLHITHTDGYVEFVSEETPIPVYGVRYRNEREDTILYVEVSQNGGHILQFYQNREITDSKYTPEQAAERAGELLEKLHFTDMACIDIDADDHIADLTFVPKQNGIYIYSDMIKIQIALDDNTILNFDQTSYATRHYQRTLPAPSISREQILQNSNPAFQVEDIRLALITDEYSVREILTYEVRGTVVDEQFSVFIDASTGKEVRIVRHSPHSAS